MTSYWQKLGSGKKSIELTIHIGLSIEFECLDPSRAVTWQRKARQARKA